VTGASHSLMGPNMSTPNKQDVFDRDCMRKIDYRPLPECDRRVICNFARYVLTTTDSIGSWGEYDISIDPAGTGFVCVYRRDENGVLTIVDNIMMSDYD
jgi:hypothetical protein